jgi:hypothetical protein
MVYILVIFYYEVKIFIKLKQDLYSSLDSKPGWKADLIKLALASSGGKHNLAASLSVKQLSL